jgi:hypothetical protein
MGGYLSSWLEGWFERTYKIRPIGEGGYIMRLGLVRYKGPRIELSDGTVVTKGDTVGEFHMDNLRAQALHGEGHGGLRFRREVFRMLPVLGTDLATRPEYESVQAVCGASLFWQEATRAGFEHRPLSAFEKWWLTWWERHLMARYHPEGQERLSEGHRTELRQLWITRKTLMRYTERAARGGGASGRIPRSSDDAAARASVRDA